MLGADSVARRRTAPLGGHTFQTDDGHFESPNMFGEVSKSLVNRSWSDIWDHNGQAEETDGLISKQDVMNERNFGNVQKNFRGMRCQSRSCFQNQAYPASQPGRADPDSRCQSMFLVRSYSGRCEEDFGDDPDDGYLQSRHHDPE